MNIDSKNEKKANVKKKTLKSDEVLKNEKETNIDKSDSINVNLKSSKEANIKKKFSKSHDIKDENSSNS